MILPEVFLRAAELIEERDWWPGPDWVAGDTTTEGETGVDGSLDLASSVMVACCEFGAQLRTRSHLAYLKSLLGIDPKDGTLAEWNDATGRTKDQVLDVLSAAAQEAFRDRMDLAE